jgi:hypothetical protein
MSYAVRKDGQGWRAVNSIDDISADEFFSQSVPVKTKSQLMAEELSALSSSYKADTLAYQLTWLSASVSDGPTEAGKKATLAIYLSELKAKYIADMASIKSKYA